MPRDFSDADEEWLDDVEGQPRPKSSEKAPLAGRGKLLPPEDCNGVVAELFPNQSAVRLDGTAQPKLCGYRMSTLAFQGANRERSPVCVGDRVRVEAGVIVGRSARRNSLSRPAPNARNPLIHVIVANIDVLAVVASARQPDFTPGIVDRFLAAAAPQKIPAIVCANKLDLLDDAAPRPWRAYASPSVTVLETCAKTGRGVEELLALIRGKTAAFCGNSGVGKTSLLRRLVGDENYGRVGTVSAAGKGRHTTTGAVMLPGPDDSVWIDTPGIMNFGVLPPPPEAV